MKIKKLEENSNRYRRLKKALFGDPSGKIRTFAVITPENPMGEPASSEENKKALKTFKTGLRYSGLTYTPLRGSYGIKEHSFIIFNCALADIKVLAKDYNQESFFFGRTEKDATSKIGYYRTSNRGETYNLVEISNVITYEDEATDFFSKLGIKFKINMREFGDDVPTVLNNGEFEESLNERRTFKSRALHRRDAYRGTTETPPIVEFYKEDGNCPVETFLDHLGDATLKIKILDFTTGHFTYVLDGIYALHHTTSRGEAVLFYFFVYGHKVILTNGVYEQVRHEGADEFALAKQYREAYHLQTRINWANVCRIFKTDALEAFAETDDVFMKSMGPHFHVRARNAAWEICVRYDASKYWYPPYKKGMKLKDKTIFTQIDRMLRAEIPGCNSRLGTYWEWAILAWNTQNETMQIPEDLKQPDYTKLTP